MRDKTLPKDSMLLRLDKLALYYQKVWGKQKHSIELSDDS